MDMEELLITAVKFISIVPIDPSCDKYFEIRDIREELKKKLNEILRSRSEELAWGQRATNLTFEMLNAIRSYPIKDLEE